MGRWIDADGLTAKLKASSAYSDYEWAMYADGFIEDMESAPSIDIVRCKECKWFNEREGCLFSTSEIEADDFCSYGERRE